VKRNWPFAQLTPLLTQVIGLTADPAPPSHVPTPEGAVTVIVGEVIEANESELPYASATATVSGVVVAYLAYVVVPPKVVVPNETPETPVVS